jgi:FdhE protein
VSEGFLGKMLGRSAPSPAVQEALADLQRLRTERPSLAAPATLLSDLLPLLAEPVPNVTAPAIPAEKAAAKLAGGLPLLRGEDVALDGNLLRRRWAAVCVAVGRHQSDNAVASLAAAAKRGQLSVEELTASVLDGRPEEVHARAEALALDTGLTATVLRFTLFPVLAAFGEALAPLRSGVVWVRGYCPTCGSWPLLGELRGLEQVRWLRCGLCAAGWDFPRLACPFCDNRNHEQLGYLHIEGEQDRRRAATCEACRGYVKTLATLGPLSLPQLLVADVSTIFLDLAAAERGYAVPAR